MAYAKNIRHSKIRKDDGKERDQISGTVVSIKCSCEAGTTTTKTLVHLY